MTITESIASAPPIDDSPPNGRERQGRRWLIVSFLFCPCHLPAIMAILGVVFGGSAFGALIRRNTIGVGIVFGATYLVLLAIGFRHLRAATKDIDCADGQCAIADD